MLAKNGICIIAALMMPVPLTSAAHAESGFQQEAQKFTLIRSGTGDKTLDSTGLASPSGYGRFLNLEKVIRQDASFTNDPDRKDRNDITRVIENYYFGDGAWTPLVGLSMGYLQKNNANDQFFAAPEIGVKYFMNPSTFFYGLLMYQFLFEDTYDVESAYDNGRFVYGVGLGLTFSY
jgi:hypothetical protein